MKPVDFRNATFDSLAALITGQRQRVFDAWGKHGPCTTRDLAARSGIDLLNVRPRTNELVLLGFVRLHERQPTKGEGTYRVATPEEFRAHLAQHTEAATTPQRQLSLGV